MAAVNDVINGVLSQELIRLEFRPFGKTFFRADEVISQIVSAVPSRFSVGKDHVFWLEITLMYGLPSNDSQKFSRLEYDEKTITSIRLNEIYPILLPYFTIKKTPPFAGISHVRETIQNLLIPFLEKTLDPEGIISILQYSKIGRMQQLGVLCALMGDKKRSRYFFLKADGDTNAIRQIAKHYGINI